MININNSYNINNIFDNLIDIKIINLKIRFDKKIYMIEQFNKLKIYKYKFYDGIKNKKENLNEYKFIKSEKFLNNLNVNYVINSAGCKISHYNLISELESNNKFTLILEDDAVLENNFYFYLMNAMKSLDIFDLLYLGCNLDNKEDAHLVSNNILKVLKPNNNCLFN